MPKTTPAQPRTIRGAREKAGLSIPEVRDAMRQFLPERLIPSESKISRMETGDIAKLDTLVVYAIARVLGVGLRDLSPTAAAELDAIRDLVERTSPCIDAWPDQLALSLN